ncbi:MAG: bifunctional DNA-formamidopyrimidine glycosylase/DNA-(apurinic or apyrimidinic site) lyase [Acidobacteriota bacterium]
MPELPEVEVLGRSLRPRIVGRRIEAVAIHAPALREPLDGDALRSLAGRRVVAVRRRAKYLLIDVAGDLTLVVHLGMSGRMTLAPLGAEAEPHEHLSWRLDGDERLRLVDPRRFGQAFVLQTHDLDNDRHFVHLGIEPLSEGFDGAYLERLAHGRRGPVKTFLMNAQVVVGVGNIYASESLWRARIHPTRSVARIASSRWIALAEAVRAVLASAIEQGGTTLNDFADGEGNAGYFQVSLAAYDREGEACSGCEGSIRRIVQANRATYYCPGCQR